MIRPLLLRIHRYAGLYMALFLIVASLTGGVLVFRIEINRWLNPEYSVAPQPGPMLDPFLLRERALALAPNSRINSLPLYVEPGDAYVVSPQPRADATRDLGFSALIINPYTGEEIHRVREAGLWPVSRHNFLAFTGALHNRLALGALGRWLFGVAALVFMFDCLVALYLALTHPTEQPAPRERSLVIRLHRGAGLFVWPALLAMALSCVAMSLPADIYLPVMKFLSPKEAFFDQLPRLPEPRLDPGLDWREARAIGQRLMDKQAKARGFMVAHEGRLAYFPEEGQFVYTVRTDQEIIRHGAFTAIYFDGVTGAQTLATTPAGDSPGSAFTLWLMAFHTGNACWAWMRVLPLVLAAALVFLSLSGLYLWWTAPAPAFPIRRKAGTGRRRAR
jgi:uncharacterized iron-regulated membrane protein